MDSIVAPPSWVTAASLCETQCRQAVSSICVLTLGPRNTGKTTFGRFIAEKCCSADIKCFWHELDPGQPAWSLPGQLSTLSCAPSTTVCSQPDKHSFQSSKSALLYGYNSPRGDPERYVACSRELLKICVERLQPEQRAGASTDSGDFNSLHIINTCGWTQGLGSWCTEQAVLPILQAISSQTAAPARLSAIICAFPGAENVVQSLQSHLKSHINTVFVSLMPAVSTDNGSSAVAVGPSRQLPTADRPTNPQEEPRANSGADLNKSLVLLSSTDGDPALARTAAAVPDELRRSFFPPPPGSTPGADGARAEGQRGNKRPRSSDDVQLERRSVAERLWQPPPTAGLPPPKRSQPEALSAPHARSLRGLTAIFGQHTPDVGAGLRAACESSKPAFRAPSTCLAGSAQQQALQHGHRYHFKKAVVGASTASTERTAASFASWSLSDTLMRTCLEARSLHTGASGCGVQVWLPLRDLTVYHQTKRIRSDSYAFSLLTSAGAGRFLSALRTPPSPKVGGPNHSDSGAAQSETVHFADVLPVHSRVVFTAVLCCTLVTHRAGRVLVLRVNAEDARLVSSTNAVALSQAPDMPVTCSAPAVDVLPPRGSGAAKHHHLNHGPAGLLNFTSPLGNLQI